MSAGVLEYGGSGTDFPATATAIKQVKHNTVVGLAPRGSGRRGIWLDNYLSIGLRVPLLLPNGGFRLALVSCE